MRNAMTHAWRPTALIAALALLALGAATAALATDESAAPDAVPPKPAATPVEITEENFETEVLTSEVPVLVDFWAQWCPPCRMVAPIVEDLAVDFAGKVKVAKCDVDNSRDVAGQYNITSIPTLIIFKGGEVVHKSVGVTSKEDLAKALESALG